MLSSGVGGSHRCLLKKKALPGTWYPLPHGVFCCLRGDGLHSKCALPSVSFAGHTDLGMSFGVHPIRS